ncbi:Wzz/FepE/Etk N-terminal domain-containing protein [Kineococcus gynurae]|uniref:Wzz/FepE/Etk N-terminal domain-containing protein n=1 Tax=Kineococcus gynurae TaxID=452979 RepID=A0ABV5LTQ8_9ACTN
MAATPEVSAQRNGVSAWGAVLRHKWTVLAVGIVMAVLGWFAAGQLLTPTYSATATITLSKDRPFDPSAASNGGNSAQLGDSTQWAALQAAVVQSSVVLEAAQAATADPAVPVDAREDLKDLLTITASTETNQITVTATGTTAADAAQTANAIATAYQTTAQATVDARVAAALAAVDTVDARASINLSAVTYGSGVASIDLADPPTAASAPYPWQIAVVGGLVGLLLAGGAVVWGAHLKQRVTAAPLTGVAELARWSSLPSGRSLSDPLSAASRSAGVVLVGLQHLGHLRTPRLEVASVLVTATSGSAGALATGLAASAARAGRRVVLVDADEAGSRLAALGAPVSSRRSVALPEGRWNEEVRPWVIGGGAIVGVLPLDARSLQPHVVGAGIRQLVEAGHLVIFVGGAVTSSPVAFAVAGEVDAVLVQVEADPRAQTVSTTMAQLSIAAPAVVAQVVVRDPSGSSGEVRSAEPRPTGAHSRSENARGRTEQLHQG